MKIQIQTGLVDESYETMANLGCLRNQKTQDDLELGCPDPELERSIIILQ